MLGVKVVYRRERLKMLVLGFVTIAEGLVQVFSLGLLTTEWRAWLLFSDWMDPS